MRRTWVIVAAVAGVVVVVLLILLLAGVFSSSDSSSSGSSASLQSQIVGPKWKVTSITTDGTKWTAPAAAKMEFTYTATDYSGNDGCNNVGGAVTFQATTITMAPGHGTLIFCGDPDSEKQTAAFHALTSGPAGAVISGSTLTLTAGSTVVAYTKS